MHDLHSKETGLYICWSAWIVYLAELIITIPHTFLGVFLSWSNLVLPMMIGITAFCIKEKCKFIDTMPDVDPYKRICKVIWFTANHNKSQSALLHNRDFGDNNFELPYSRFDWGKEKYGGPFTAKQVEEVKLLLRIFGILLTLGSVLMMDFVVHELLLNLEFHMDGYPLFDTIVVDFIMNTLNKIIIY